MLGVLQFSMLLLELASELDDELFFHLGCMMQEHKDDVVHGVIWDHLLESATLLLGM